MKKVPCALCLDYNNYEVLYKENFDFDTLDEKIFSTIPIFFKKLPPVVEKEGNYFLYRSQCRSLIGKRVKKWIS